MVQTTRPKLIDHTHPAFEPLITFFMTLDRRTRAQQKQLLHAFLYGNYDLTEVHKECARRMREATESVIVPFAKAQREYLKTQRGQYEANMRRRKRGSGRNSKWT